MGSVICMSLLPPIKVYLRSRLTCSQRAASLRLGLASGLNALPSPSLRSIRRCSQRLGRSFGTGGKVSQLGIFCDLLSVFPHSAGNLYQNRFCGFDQCFAPISYIIKYRRTHGSSSHSLRTFDTPGCVGSFSEFSQARKAIYYNLYFHIMQVLFRPAHTVPWLRESNKSASAEISSQQKPMLHYKLWFSRSDSNNSR